MPQPDIHAVPTNVITGFLGVGKTTAITRLLARKPDIERWAVLVNEFGEIGVDGSLVKGGHGEDQGIYVREVPGGCMCCTAGLPMQIALNQLLARARPHRLLIEPTGLGHPEEVLQTLAAEHYRDVLRVQRTITLVDARKLSDPRYTGHATFNQQIGIADVVVGNKQDLYGPDDQQRLRDYVRDRSATGAVTVFTRHGDLAPEWLEGACAATSREPQPSFTPARSTDQSPGMQPTLLKAGNQGEGYQSIGWRFEGDTVFDRHHLFAFLSGLQAERMKAVFITCDGIFGYNLTADGLTEIPLDECLESRIEIIATDLDAHWEEQLMACRTTDP